MQRKNFLHFIGVFRNSPENGNGTPYDKPVQARRLDAELRLRAALRLYNSVGGHNEKAMDLDRCSCSGNTYASVPHGNQPVYGGFDRAADRWNCAVGFRSGGDFVGTLHSEE